MAYTPLESYVEQVIPITFLATGEIDLTRTSLQNLTMANTLLAPTISILELVTSGSSLEFWELANWVLVSYYWLYMTDLGQTAPTYYTHLPDPFRVTVRQSHILRKTIYLSMILFSTYIPLF